MMMHLSTSQRTAKMTKVIEGLSNDDASLQKLKKRRGSEREGRKLTKASFQRKPNHQNMLKLNEDFGLKSKVLFKFLSSFV